MIVKVPSKPNDCMILLYSVPSCSRNGKPTDSTKLSPALTLNYLHVYLQIGVVSLSEANMSSPLPHPLEIAPQEARKSFLGAVSRIMVTRWR